MNPTAIIYHTEVSGYDFGPGHPFRGERFANFMRLLNDLDFFKESNISIVEPKLAGIDLLGLVHSHEYLREVERRSKIHIPLTGDTPLSPTIVEAARLIVGTSVKAGELVSNGTVTVAEGVGGGLHHAGRSYGGGFCVYNDVAVCAINLLERQGLERVMVLDSDVHAGNGTMDIFYEDPRVLFVSVHQDPRTLYPGTGFAHQLGGGDGEGYTVNVPLPPGADDRCMSLFLEDIFKPLAQDFKPQIIIRNGGADPHHLDGLGSLNLSFQGLWQIGKTVAEVADSVNCGIVDLCCSGYNPSTVAQGWASLLFGAIGKENPIKDHEPLSRSPVSIFEETIRVIEALKEKLAHYWSISE